MVPNEMNILLLVSHPYLVNLDGVIITTNFLNIVLEFANAIQLFDKIIHQTKLNKKKTKLEFY